MKRILKILLGVVVLVTIAAGGYYFTHKQEIAKLYTNSEFMSKYARYTQQARQLVTFNMNFKDSNIDVFYVRQLVAEEIKMTMVRKDKEHSLSRGIDDYIR